MDGGTNPIDADSDDDRLTDSENLNWNGSDNPDSDGDGFQMVEVKWNRSTCCNVEEEKEMLLVQRVPIQQVYGNGVNGIHSFEKAKINH